MTELSAEDALRLAVLMSGEVHAVRIDERAPALHALTPKGEARVALNPNCRLETYLIRVRETLGSYALNSATGYPAHVRHWTRMGQVASGNLEALLKLGEPEAAAAVAHAPGLTDELARRVWWALPTVDIARVMLASVEVRRGATGQVLADFLIEHLPFETEPMAAMNTVRVVLAAGLLDEAGRMALWQKARRRPYYLIGFLESLPDALPADEPPRELPAVLADRCDDDPRVTMLGRCYASAGQAWLKTMELALDRAPAHEAVYLLLDLVGAYFAAVWGPGSEGALPGLERETRAMAALAAVSSRDAEEILVRTTAVGALLRRKIDPLVAPLLGHLRTLQGTTE